MAAPKNPLERWLLITPKAEPREEQSQSSATPDAPDGPRRALAWPVTAENANMLCTSEDEDLEEEEEECRQEGNEEQSPATSRPATINSEIVAIGGGYLESFRTDILLRQWVTEVHEKGGGDSSPSRRKTSGWALGSAAAGSWSST